MRTYTNRPNRITTKRPAPMRPAMSLPSRLTGASDGRTEPVVSAPPAVVRSAEVVAESEVVAAVRSDVVAVAVAVAVSVAPVSTARAAWPRVMVVLYVAMEVVVESELPVLVAEVREVVDMEDEDEDEDVAK